MIVEPGTICETEFGAPAYIEWVDGDVARGIRRKGRSVKVIPFHAEAWSLREPSGGDSEPRRLVLNQGTEP